jgi:exodeoxyribonuclease VII large subunit
VVRAAASSQIPLISAIGHETDWTLLDLVADVRAPTPTGAAEIAVPVKAELESACSRLSARLSGAITRKFDRARAELGSATRGLGKPDKILQAPRQRIDAAAIGLAARFRSIVEDKRGRFIRAQSRLNVSLLENRTVRLERRLAELHSRAREAQRRRIANCRNRFERATGRLTPRRLETVLERCRSRLDGAWRLAVGLGPESVLQRGYAIVRRASGETVTETAMLAAGERFNLQMRDGAIDALALKEGPSAKPGQKKSGGRDGPGSDRQGDLF